MTNVTRPNQERIFRELYNKYKGSPMAVSSESVAHKELRFSQICGVYRDDDDFSLHDVGMGLADLYSYIQKIYSERKIEYSGTEILEEYVREASLRFRKCKFYQRDIAERAFSDTYDYVVMSGVFHQRRESSIRDWEIFCQNIIANSFEMCRKGIAFNFISPFVDYYQLEVYYCNLPKILNFINDDLSRFFQIKHDYALFEFTVYVYKERYIQSLYTEPEFQRYFRK